MTVSTGVFPLKGGRPVIICKGSPESVNVSCGANILGSSLAYSGGMWKRQREPQHLPGLGVPLFLQPFGQTEIRDLGCAIQSKHDVGRLEVAMDDTGLMSSMDCSVRSVANNLAATPLLAEGTQV